MALKSTGKKRGHFQKPMTCRVLGNSLGIQNEKNRSLFTSRKDKPARQLFTRDLFIHPFFHLSNNYLLRPCDVFPSVMLGNESEGGSLPSWTWSATEKQQATFIKYSKWSKGWCWWERDHAAKKASCIRRYPHPISMVNTKETRRETERKVVHGNIKGQELTEITQVCHILVGSLQCGPSACLPVLSWLCVDSLLTSLILWLTLCDSEAG